VFVCENLKKGFTGESKRKKGFTGESKRKKGSTGELKREGHGNGSRKYGNPFFCKICTYFFLLPLMY